VEPETHPSFIAIARIARTRGNRGEVLADLYTDFPDRFHELEEVWLEFADGRRQRMAIEDAWAHKGRQVLKFVGIDNISAAEAFVGCWIQIPLEQAANLPAGTYFDHDLIGCSVYDIQDVDLGIVREVLHIAGSNLLAVKGPEREYMIPAVESICIRISIEEKRIVIDPPEGLLDLSK
jgi:16S rRNA processing protein RimM